MCNLRRCAKSCHVGPTFQSVAHRTRQRYFSPRQHPRMWTPAPATAEPDRPSPVHSPLPGGLLFPNVHCLSRDPTMLQSRPTEKTITPNEAPKPMSPFPSSRSKTKTTYPKTMQTSPRNMQSTRSATIVARIHQYHAKERSVVAPTTTAATGTSNKQQTTAIRMRRLKLSNTKPPPPTASAIVSTEPVSTLTYGRDVRVLPTPALAACGSARNLPHLQREPRPIPRRCLRW